MVIFIRRAISFIQEKQRYTTTLSLRGGHHRHTDKNGVDPNVRVVRSVKNRYIYFCTSSKKLLKQWKESLSYDILPYPKEQNQNYILGEYIQPLLVDRQTKEAIPNKS